MRLARCGKWRSGVPIDKINAAGIDPDERGDLTCSASHDAAEHGCYRIMKRWLNPDGLDPNVQSRHDIKPLHYAASSGHLAVVRLLLQYGANPNMQDKDGESAFDGELHFIAARGGYYRESAHYLVTKSHESGSILCYSHTHWHLEDMTVRAIETLKRKL
jgi:hypothetical protein